MSRDYLDCPSALWPGSAICLDGRYVHGQSVGMLRDIDGLTIRGASNPNRVQVEASDEAIAEARRRVEPWYHIEAAIPHRPT